MANNSSPINKGHHGESAASIQLQPISHATQQQAQQGHLSQNRHTNIHSNNNGSNNCSVNSVASNGKSGMKIPACESQCEWREGRRKITASLVRQQRKCQVSQGQSQQSLSLPLSPSFAADAIANEYYFQLQPQRQQQQQKQQ